MQTSDLVVIAEYASYTEAQMAKSVVASAGIYTEVRNQHMSTAYAVAIPAQLLVPYDDAEQASIATAYSFQICHEASAWA